MSKEKMIIEYCKDDFEYMLGKKLTDDDYETMADYIERHIDVHDIVEEMVVQYSEGWL